jgi:hypothetical protein
MIPKDSSEIQKFITFHPLFQTTGLQANTVEPRL